MSVFNLSNWAYFVDDILLCNSGHVNTDANFAVDFCRSLILFTTVDMLL